MIAALRRLGTLPGIGVLAVAYGLVGWITEAITGLSIYGIPIWLPTGVAVGALLLAGTRLWPGIWLGAFAFTIYRLTGPLGASFPLLPSLAAAAVIATATSLECVLAAWLARRRVDPELHFDTPDSVIRFVLLCGPLACLVGATISIGALYGVGRIPTAALFENWFSWWAGDTIGTVIGATLLLAALGEPKSLWRPRLLTVAAPLAIGILITFAAFSFTASLDRQRTRLEFEKQATLLASALRTALSVAEDATGTVASFVRLSPTVDRAAFDAFAQDLHSRHPGIQAIEWVPRVTQDALERHEQDVRAQGLAEYRVVEKDAAGHLGKVAPRAEYFPVQFLYPLAGNEAVLGFDLASEATRREAMQRAFQRRAMTVSPRVGLLQGSGHFEGVLAFQPVFGHSKEAAGGALLGYTLSVLRIDELARTALAGLPQDQIAYCIEDLDSPEDLAVLYLVGTPTPDRSWRAVTVFDYGGRRWQLSFGPTVEYLATHRVSYLWLVYGAALSAALLLTAFLLMLTGRTNRIETLVEHRTVELSVARRSAERASNLLQEAVRSITLGFTIYDENDRLVICNDAYRAFHPELGPLIQPGVSFEHLVRTSGERGNHPLGEMDVEAWVQDRVRRHRTADGTPFEIKMGDGRWLLVVEQRTPSGFVVSNRVDITDLKAANAAVQDRNAQLDALFRLCPDGFVAFDPEGRVRFVNPALLAMTGLGPTDVIGCAEAQFNALLRERAEDPAAFGGVGAYFAEGDEVPPFKRLAMKLPKATTLQIVGIRSKSPNVPRLLYFRDITREAEVDRMKSEFLSHAAHELRTPMTSIFGFSELLLHSEFDESTRRELVETIHGQTAWLVQIINELLDLARIDERRGRDFVLADTDLVVLVRETLAGVAIDPALWPVDAELPARPVWIRADAAKARQALTNVLGNARKYSPRGGAIDVRILERGDGIGIQVRDRGIGMSADQVARVGERLWRADTSGTTPGTGLGMAIVKEILELHGGRVEVESALGVGTSVTLWWPPTPATTA
jgi:signal transduction histidine kinase/CHASE1-domain containing sensor protein